MRSQISCRPLWLFLAIFFVLQIGFAAGALAAQKPAIFLILDASGSMWGRVDGQTKIEAAKTVVAELIGPLPTDIETGLMVYGHRRKGDCSDIEVVTALGADRKGLLENLGRILPKGKTPLSKALADAGGNLAARETETTLVLVSDGIETCKGDPCATIEDLRQKGLKVVVHVVGFDVRGEAVTQLQCIARAGGGSYFQADNVSALRDALSAVRAAVTEDKPLPPPPAAEVPAAQSTSKRIRIAGPGKVVLKPAPWVAMPPRFWALEEAESGDRKATGNGLEARVKAGEYLAVWRQSEHGHTDVQLTAAVRVESGKTSELPLDTGLELIVPAGVGPPRWWGLVAPGAEKPAIRFSQTLAPQVTPAGTFELVWRQEEHGAMTARLGPVTIESGRLNQVAVDSGIVLQPAEWVTKKPYYYALLDDKGDRVGSWRMFGPQLVGPGRYTLLLRPTEHHHRDIVWGPVEIDAHGITPVAINSGIQFIHQADARPPYGVFLVNLEDESEIVMGRTWDPLPVPPGRYRIDWWQQEHASRRETIVDEVVVEAGMVLEMEM